MKKDEWQRNYEREQLRLGRALRIRTTVYHASDTIDIDKWKELPPNATMEYRCNRAWFLRNFWNNSDTSGPSFNYWARHVEPYSYMPDGWTDIDRSNYDDALLKLKDLEEMERRNKGRRRWRDRSARKPQRNARRNWRKLRDYMLSRYPGFAAALCKLG